MVRLKEPYANSVQLMLISQRANANNVYMMCKFYKGVQLMQIMCNDAYLDINKVSRLY